MDKKLTNVPAERAVISGIIQHGEDSYLDVADILQVDTFTDRTTQALYIVLVRMIEQEGMSTIDEASLFSTAKNLKYDWLFEGEEGDYVSSIMQTRIDEANVRMWAAKIRKLHVARLLQYQLLEANMSLDDISGDEPIEHIMGLVENRIFDFSLLLQHNDEIGQPSLIGDGLGEYLKHLSDNPVDMVGISSGFPIWDASIGGGFRRKTVNLVGARTGVGKGQMGVNVSIHVAQKLGIPVLYLDTEMAKEDHYLRAVANQSAVKINDIETGKFIKNDANANSVRNAYKALKDIPYTYVGISGKPFEETLAIIRRWLHKTVGYRDDGVVNDCLIIYDYVKLMTSDSITRNLAEYQVLGFQMTGLHNFAVRHDVPFLSFVQLNRDGIDREATDVVSGSDRVVWLCSNLSVYKPKTQDEIANDGGDVFGNMKLVPLKCRHGAGIALGDYISISFDGSISQLIEIDTRYNLKNKNNGSNTIAFNLDNDIEVVIDDPQNSSEPT